MGDEIVAAGMVTGAVQELNKSVKLFSDSSDKLGKTMIVIMIVQITIAIFQIFLFLVKG